MVTSYQRRCEGADCAAEGGEGDGAVVVVVVISDQRRGEGNDYFASTSSKDDRLRGDEKAPNVTTPPMMRSLLRGTVVITTAPFNLRFATRARARATASGFVVLVLSSSPRREVGASPRR